MADRFGFRVLTTDGDARRGEIRTAHGVVDTPAFMPVGTQGAVKALYPEQVAATGAQVVLGNTYHLMLRPGAERVARLGGLHRFMNWPHTILTDSGGFQVMSLATLRKIDEGGVTFRSHVDGSEHRLTPERAIEIQTLLGADIQMQLDECVRLPAATADVERAVELSLNWAERSRAAFLSHPENADGRALFAIVQGGTDHALRARAADALARKDFEGYAIGGLAVGEPQPVMFEVIAATAPHLPKDRPRYLMGVGTPDDIIGAVARGIDMFDCVLPTRGGRHGQAYTRHGRLNLKNARFADDPRPLDAGSTCPASRTFSRAYLHHLVKAGETLAAMVLTWNNVAYYQSLMRELREAIAAGAFAGRAATLQDALARGEDG